MDFAHQIRQVALTRSRQRATLLIWLILTAAITQVADAHRLRPAVVTADFASGGVLTLSIKANFEVLVAGIKPQHRDTKEAPEATQYDNLRALPSAKFADAVKRYAPRYIPTIQVQFDKRSATLELVEVVVPVVDDLSRARITTLVMHATVPTDAKMFTWRYPDEYGGSALRISIDSAAPEVTQWLPAEATSKPYAIGSPLRAKSTLEVAKTYTWLGFVHILPRGLDHILFVLGVFLLSIRLRPVLWQVTAFTVAHSITLGLALFGYVSVPASFVEPLIALSIVYVGVENLFTKKLKSWRVFIVFLFGLLHGMGFAGVLLELGLPAGETVAALITFNVGVELGQLSVIAIALLAGAYWWRERVWFRGRVVVPGSAIIALIGAWWTVERTLLGG
jgi:hydrogenase/urease accessory protein HupE